MGRDYLAHSIGDAINVVLAAASSNEVLAAPNPDRLSSEQMRFSQPTQSFFL
jgi:hypothetical protein